MVHINSNLSASFGPLHFSYCHKRSMTDNLSLSRDLFLEHLHNNDTYIRFLFTVWMSTFLICVDTALTQWFATLNILPVLKADGISQVAAVTLMLLLSTTRPDQKVPANVSRRREALGELRGAVHKLTRWLGQEQQGTQLQLGRDQRGTNMTLMSSNLTLSVPGI